MVQPTRSALYLVLTWEYLNEVFQKLLEQSIHRVFWVKPVLTSPSATHLDHSILISSEKWVWPSYKAHLY